MRVRVFDLVGDDEQNAIVEQAIVEQSYPWERILPGLYEQTGRDAIPVEWADLSRYTQELEAAERSGAHLHFHEDGDTGHPIAGDFEGRRRVLGLAWYSGKVTIEQSLKSQPVLARVVFHSEGAHMADFFDSTITPEVRTRIFALYHPDLTQEQIDAHYGEHGWFEETGNNDYWSWVGESFMEGFIYAFTPLRPSSTRFDHQTTEEIGQQIRELLLPTEPPMFGAAGSTVFHDSHRGITTAVTFPSWAAAIDAGRRPCRVCKPEPS